jgi:hypothetical protein
MKWPVVVATLGVRVASAGVVQVPEGGKPVPVVAKGVVCGPLQGGWTIDAADRRMVVPPAAGAPNLARTLEVRVADSAAGCAGAKQTVTLIALGPWPELDGAGTVLFPDEGRIEIKGQRLKGVQVAWSAPQVDKTPARQGADACLDPGTAKPQACAVPLAAGLPADVPLFWLPAFGRFGEDVVTYDAFGAKVEREGLRLRPARVVLSKALVQSGGIDMTNGPARVSVAHPEAVSSVDCGGASCELVDGAVLVRSVPMAVAKISVRLKLAPRVVVTRGDAFDAVVTASLPILSCPMAVVAGTVMRDVDDPSAVVKLDPSCGRDPNGLRWLANGEQAEVVRVVKASDGSYVLLHLLRVTAEKVTVIAARPELDNTIVASATGKTVPMPVPRVSLELAGHGKIDFVPTNRPAIIKVANVGELGVLVPVTVPGVYAVTQDAGTPTIRAAENVEGFASVRLAYRLPGLPAELASADLAIITEHVQRAVREAAVPAAIGASAYDGTEPIVELVCDNGRVAPGSRYRIPWDARDSCRVVLHGERLRPADGGQEITVEIEVFKADNTPRPDAKVSEHLVLRPGSTTRVIPVKSGLTQFDRVEVRVSHVLDESRYVVSAMAPAKPGVLAAQWSAIVDGGRFRLYATAAIPAGLYRVTDPSGQLTLNFGVLSRLTMLDRSGKERLFGAELGVMGLALAPQQSNVIFPVTLAIVTGVGIRVPLGQGASLGIQAWVAREFRDGAIKVRNPDGTTTDQRAGNWSFIFGPSISFGNVGLNL